MSERCLAVLAAALLLSACANWDTDWDWRSSGRSVLESVCNSFGNCGVACTDEEPAGWCEPPRGAAN